MKSKDFLRSKGILSNDSHHFIIDFHDGREINLGDLLEEYAQQSQPSSMRWVKASERLPENGVGPLKYIWIRNIQTKAGGMQPLADYKKIDGIENTEWLDESSPAGAAEGANDVDYLG